MPVTPRRREARWTFALVSAGGVMMTLDVTAVSVALHPIARDLHAPLDRLQWIVAVYSLAFGALLLTAGALSDRIGRRVVFASGMAVFTVASAACGAAPSAETLILARAAQGLGGALVFAPTLALLADAWPTGHAQRRAIAGFALVASTAGAAGPLIGGALTELLHWRWIFLVNVPVGAAAAVAALRRLPGAGPRATGRRTDIPGALLAVGALLALHYPLIAGRHAGWTSTEVLAAAGAGVALTVTFAASQLRPDALLDLALLRAPGLASAAALGFLGRMTGVGVLAFVTLWLQGAQERSPIQTGLALLPLTGALFTVGVFAARLQLRLSPARLVGAGFALQALGLGLLAGAGAGWPAGWGTAGLALLGAGGAVIFPPLMGVAVGAAPAGQIGMASGLANACYPLGTAAGVAVFGAVFSAYGGRPGNQGLDVATGFTATALTAAVVCAVGALLAATLPHRSPERPHRNRRRELLPSRAQDVALTDDRESLSSPPRLRDYRCHHGR